MDWKTNAWAFCAATGAGVGGSAAGAAEVVVIAAGGDAADAGDWGRHGLAFQPLVERLACRRIYKRNYRFDF